MIINEHNKIKTLSRDIGRRKEDVEQQQGRWVLGFKFFTLSQAHTVHGCKIRSRPQPSGALPCLLVLSRHDTKLGPFSGRATNQADRTTRPLDAGLPGLCWRMGQRGELQLPSHHSRAERA